MHQIYATEFQYSQGWMKMMYDEHEQDLQETFEPAKPQRLNPAAIYFNLIKVIKETIFGLGAGFIFTIKQSLFYSLMFLLIFLVVTIVTSVLSWLRYTYRVEDNELRIEQGVFIRKKRYVPINRIHKIDFTANVVHRIFGLVKIQIDTASGGGAEVSLSAVTIAKGEQLRAALKKQAEETEIDTDEDLDEPKEEIKEKLTWKRLLITGSTSGSAGLILAAIFVIFSQAGDLVPESMYESTFHWIASLSIVFIVALIVFLLLLLWVFGIAGTMIRYGNFQISKLEDGLFIKRGLLETKELTIPYDRIQAIGVEQSLIRQPFKFVSVVAVVAGGSIDKLETYPVLFPLMREKEVNQFLQKFLPDYGPVKKELIPLSKKGLKYYLFNTSIIFILATIPVLYFFPKYSWIPFIFVAISLWFGWLRYKDGGYIIEGKRLTLRSRLFNKTTMMIYHKRIQAFEKYQHKLQRMQQISSIETPLLGAMLGKYKHLNDEDANKIADWFSYRKKAGHTEIDIEVSETYFEEDKELMQIDHEKAKLDGRSYQDEHFFEQNIE